MMNMILKVTMGVESHTRPCWPCSRCGARDLSAHQAQILPIPRRRNALAGRVGPRCITTRGDPKLTLRDDVPVLPVRDVPESDRIARVEARASLIARMEHPFGFDHRP